MEKYKSAEGNNAYEFTDLFMDIFRLEQTAKDNLHITFLEDQDNIMIDREIARGFVKILNKFIEIGTLNEA